MLAQAVAGPEVAGAGEWFWYIVTMSLMRVVRVEVGGGLWDVGVAVDVDEEEGGVEVGMENCHLALNFITDIIMHCVLVRTVNSCPPKLSCIGSWQRCHGNNVILPYFRWPYLRHFLRSGTQQVFFLLIRSVTFRKTGNFSFYKNLST